LGISDLKLAVTAFEAKWLWLQKTDRDRAWAELPLKLTDKARAFFRASTYTVVGKWRTHTVLVGQLDQRGFHHSHGTHAAEICPQSHRQQADGCQGAHEQMLGAPDNGWHIGTGDG
jgi:hypothetical protein